MSRCCYCDKKMLFGLLCYKCLTFLYIRTNNYKKLKHRKTELELMKENDINCIK